MTVWLSVRIMRLSGIKVLVDWVPSGTVVQSRHESVLSQVSTHPDMSLDVARTKSNTQQTKQTQLCTHPNMTLVVATM